FVMAFTDNASYSPAGGTGTWTLTIGWSSDASWEVEVTTPLGSSSDSGDSSSDGGSEDSGDYNLSGSSNQMGDGSDASAFGTGNVTDGLDDGLLGADGYCGGPSTITVYMGAPGTVEGSTSVGRKLK